MTKTDKWYKNCYRRHLLDMHVEDWDEKFLSEFSPEDYVDNLRRAKIQAAMIYLQSHVGLCNFPTKSGREHKAFVNGDKISRLIGLCRKNGIKVVGYYSLIHNNRAEDDHPDWRMVDDSGKTEREKGGRYGFVCPNNAGYREFVAEQIAEMKEAFPDLDGMFYDMPFWPTTCRCPACKARWAKEVGGELPQPDVHAPEFETYAKKLREWMADFCAFVAEKTHEIMPGATIEFNNAGVVAFDWTAGESEMISDLADYVGGDLYGDLSAHSFSCKYFYAITQNQPFEYMNSRCVRLLEHTATKDREYLETEIALTRAHHGATFVIDAIDPIGTMDKRVYDLLGDIFSGQIPLEKYNTGELLSDVAVFFDSGTQFDRDGLGFGNKKSAVSAVRRLTERHIPVSVIANGHTGKLDGYKCVIAPSLENFGNPEIEKFIAYVENGGCLYISGKSDNRLIERLIGCRFKKYTDSKMTYVAPSKAYENVFSDFNAKYPVPFGNRLPVMENGGSGMVLATVCLPYTDPEDNMKFASIHSNPPGILTDIPAVIYAKAGKGQVIWSAGAFENDDRKAIGDIFVNLINLMTGGDYLINADASKNLETVTFGDGKDYYIGAVSLSADDKCVYPIEISIKTQSKPKKITELASGEEIGFTFENGRAAFKDEVRLHKSYKIEMQE